MISIKNKNKGAVLAALYNNSKPQGMGLIHFTPENMTVEQGEKLIEEISEDKFDPNYFDYLQGRVMKVDLSKDEFDPRLYDRDNGEDAALNSIKSI